MYLLSVRSLNPELIIYIELEDAVVASDVYFSVLVWFTLFFQSRFPYALKRLLITPHIHNTVFTTLYFTIFQAIPEMNEKLWSQTKFATVDQRVIHAVSRWHLWWNDDGHPYVHLYVWMTSCLPTNIPAITAVPAVPDLAMSQTVYSDDPWLTRYSGVELFWVNRVTSIM